MAAKKAAPTVIPGTSPMMTQPAFMGNNQNLLAQQLSAGGYGSMPDLMQMLTQTFTPMQVLDTRTPPPAPAPTTPAPVTPTPKPPTQGRPGLQGWPNINPPTANNTWGYGPTNLDLQNMRNRYSGGRS
jgi:hypothetical protein